MKKRLLFFAPIIFFTIGVNAQHLLAGTASVNIVPKLPVALQGQMYLRVGDKVESP